MKSAFFNIFNTWRAARRSRKIIIQSGFFDKEYYAAHNIDLVLEGKNLLDHYISIGWREGRQPSAEFDIIEYIEHNQDVARAGIEPIQHYVLFGQKEGRSILSSGMPRKDRSSALERLRQSGMFDSEFYLSQCPVLRSSGFDPLLHYLLTGYEGSIEPSPNLSMMVYLATKPMVRHHKLNPLLHYIDSGCPDGFTASEINPKIHWIAREDGYRLPDDVLELEWMMHASFVNQYSLKLSHSQLLFQNAIESLIKTCPKLILDNKKPDVTIIISVIEQSYLLLPCLNSLSRQNSRYSVEIIVVSLTKLPVEMSALHEISWINHLIDGATHNPYEQAKKVALGKNLIFLNHDMLLAQGCIDEWIDLLEQTQDSSCIIPKICDERGNIFGSPEYFEALNQDIPHKEAKYLSLSGNHPHYCYIRPITSNHKWFDTVFSVVAIKKKTLVQYPDFLESSEIWFQPFARLILQKTDNFLQDHTKIFSLSTPSTFIKENPKKRLLVIDALTPTPDQDSGSYITLKMLKAYLQLGFEITFVPAYTYEWNSAYSVALQKLGIRCLYKPFFFDINSLIDNSSEFDYVLIYRFDVMASIIDTLRQKLPKARIIFHNVDLHYLRELREAELKEDRSGRIRSALTQTKELEMFASSDCSIVHTSVEYELIKDQIAIDNIIEFPYIADVYHTKVSFDCRKDIMFLGGYKHLPNLDAVSLLIKEIWPILLQHLPEEARLLIVGASPPAKVQAYANERIIVTGMVSDLVPWFDRARVFVAPLRYGAGIKGKLIQSLAHGVPSVATNIAAEGIGLTSGREALIADDVNDIISAIITLYDKKSSWENMQSRGYEFIEQNYSWERCIELCNDALNVADNTWLRRQEWFRSKHINNILVENGHSGII